MNGTISRMARYRECIFCRRSKYPLSKEDIFPKWLAREFPRKDKSKFKVEQFLSGGPEGPGGEKLGQFHAVGNLGFVVSGPCERCNNGWMSRMETRVKPILRPMMWGKSSELGPDERLALTRWLIKVAIMYEYRESRLKNIPRYFKPRDRLALATEPHTLPPNIHVFLGHYGGNFALWTSDAPVPMQILSRGERSEFSTYSLTFSIGQLAFQLFTLRWPVESGATEMKFTLPEVFDLATVQLWPATYGTIRWPPEVKLDDEGMHNLSRTWRKPNKHLAASSE